MDHILGNEMYFTKFKLIEVTQHLLSDDNGIKFKIKERKDGKLSSIQKLNTL